jgi:hypothetical protein
VTGPHHYRTAEELLAKAIEVKAADIHVPDRIVALAQVHATLALAAATALNDAERGLTVSDWTDWQDTCGVTP